MRTAFFREKRLKKGEFVINKMMLLVLGVIVLAIIVMIALGIKEKILEHVLGIELPAVGE
jgi:hypothetical protein